MSYREYTEADFQPRKLSLEEITDPYLVIDELFDFDHLPGIRELLWEWIKTTVIGNYYTHNLDKRDRFNLMFFYEKIERLIEAVHVIHSTQKKEKSANGQNEDIKKKEISGLAPIESLQNEGNG